MLGIDDTTRKWWILVAMGAVWGLVLLDEIVVAVALPTIRDDLAMAEVAAHWVVSIYLLVFTVFAAAGGRLGDMTGFKSTLALGAVLFGLASLGCGFADSGASLIASRGVEGLGAAMLFPATLSVVMLVFPKEQRGMAIGVLAAVGTVFMAAGPLVGGFLTEVLSWRWIFWINVPIVLACALLLSIAWIDLPRQERRSAFDTVGLATLVVGLSLLVYAIMEGESLGWTQAAILASLIGGVVLLALFVWLEARRDDPLIEIDLFRSAEFSACTLIILVSQYGKISLFVFGALYLHDELGMSPLTTGLALMVAVWAFPFLSAPAGRLADKYGSRRLLLSGLSVATVGILWLGFAVAWDSYVWLLPGFILWGLGMPFCYSPTLRTMANAAPLDKQGQTSGIGITARILGGTLGMAVGSTLLLMTGDFAAVFVTTAATVAAGVVFGWFAIERLEAEPVRADRV